MPTRSPPPGLQLDEHLDHQRRSWRLQRIAWLLFGLLVTSAMLGAFGNGPLSRSRVRSADGRLDVELQRVLRAQARTEIVLRIAPMHADDAHVDLLLGQDYLQAAPTRSLLPTPWTVEHRGDGLRYRFGRRPGSHAPLRVVLEVEPQVAGRLHLRAASGARSRIAFDQWVLP